MLTIGKGKGLIKEYLKNPKKRRIIKEKRIINYTMKKNILPIILVIILIAFVIGYALFSNLGQDNEDQALKNAKTHFSEKYSYNIENLQEPLITKKQAELLTINANEFRLNLLLVKNSNDLSEFNVACPIEVVPENITEPIGISGGCFSNESDSELIKSLVTGNKYSYDGEIGDFENKLTNAKWTKQKIDVFEVDFLRNTEGLGCQPTKISIYLDMNGKLLAPYEEIWCID
ncbi:hypothetical protein KKG83_06485 [Candidatus Micrarchaeota archaeon]|nr:hypothetical protein [Candidatus Micrarchaeota archaeon]